MPQSGFGENVGQSELAARVGSLKGMLAGANSRFLTGVADFDTDAITLAGIEFVRIQAMAAVLQVEMAMSEPLVQAESLFDGMTDQDPHGRRLDGE